MGVFGDVEVSFFGTRGCIIEVEIKGRYVYTLDIKDNFRILRVVSDVFEEFFGFLLGNNFEILLLNCRYLCKFIFSM